MKWEKNELKCFSCNSMQHELFLSSINMSQSTPLCLKQEFEDVTFETSPDLLYIVFQQHSGYFIGGACRRMTVLQ